MPSLPRFATRRTRSRACPRSQPAMPGRSLGAALLDRAGAAHPPSSPLEDLPVPLHNRSMGGCTNLGVLLGAMPKTSDADSAFPPTAAQPRRKHPPRGRCCCCSTQRTTKSTKSKREGKLSQNVELCYHRAASAHSRGQDCFQHPVLKPLTFSIFQVNIKLVRSVSRLHFNNFRACLSPFLFLSFQLSQCPPRRQTIEEGQRPERIQLECEDEGTRFQESAPVIGPAVQHL